MDLALDARAHSRPHSSYARVLQLLEESARAAGLKPALWEGGPCAAAILWSPRIEPPPVQGPRLVLTLHDVNPLIADGRPFYWRFRREVRFRRKAVRGLKAAWRVATDSRDARSRIEAAFPGARGKLRVVPLYAGAGMEPGKPDRAVLARLGLEPGYLLFVGALRRHKNWETLVRAFARLPARLRKLHPLVLAGDPRRAGRRLEALARREMVAGEVVVPGVVGSAALPELYRGAALFVFPSLAEGFGLPPLEAMACGVPVVSSDRTCLPEVLGDAPRYCDPTDPAAMAAAIEAVLSDGHEAARLRAAGLVRAAGYGPERTGAAMRALLAG